MCKGGVGWRGKLSKSFRVLLLMDGWIFLTTLRHLRKYNRNPINSLKIEVNKLINYTNKQNPSTILNHIIEVNSPLGTSMAPSEFPKKTTNLDPSYPKYRPPSIIWQNDSTTL